MARLDRRRMGLDTGMVGAGRADGGAGRAEGLLVFVDDFVDEVVLGDAAAGDW